jgi:hypothetical protein
MFLVLLCYISFPAPIQVSILWKPGMVVTMLGESMDVEKSIITNTHMSSALLSVASMSIQISNQNTGGHPLYPGVTK